MQIGRELEYEDRSMARRAAHEPCEWSALARERAGACGAAPARSDAAIVGASPISSRVAPARFAFGRVRLHTIPTLRRARDGDRGRLALRAVNRAGAERSRLH
jgi:hypothetical protein